MEMTVRQILMENGIKFKETSGSEIIVRDICGGKKPKLYVNTETGLWYCHHCGEKGHIKALIRRLTGLSSSIGEIVQAEAKKAPLAPIERRDAVYRKIHLPMSQQHVQGLMDRGFKRMPKDYLECGSASVDGNTSGVPGFVDGALVPLPPGIMIPYKDFLGRIQSFQIRQDEGDPKYFWLSARKFGGAGGSFCHYACKRNAATKEPIFNYRAKGKNCIAVTEGALKADLFFQLSGVPTLALPGVQQLKLFEREVPLLKKAGVEAVYNLFDMDYITNKQVKRASDKLEAIIKKTFEYQRPKWNVKFKGIDDYYAFLVRTGVRMSGFSYIKD